MLKEEGFASYGSLPTHNVDQTEVAHKDEENTRLNNFKLFGLGLSIPLLAVILLIMAANTLKTPFDFLHGKTLNLEESSEFTLTSSAFQFNGSLPDIYTCKLGEGTGVSPPLQWSNPPAGTVEYFVTMWKISGYSWSVYNISKSIDHLDEATSGVGMVAGTVAWDIDVPPYIDTSNYVSMYKYEEPCSKGPGAKLYIFTVYAFSQRLEPLMTAEKYTRDDINPVNILELMDSKGYILGKASINSYFELYGDDDTSASSSSSSSASSSSTGGGGASSSASGSSTGKKIVKNHDGAPGASA
jgi:phosphatidylethanolamine-binding protein (PEBP) family uncharacterized protein